MSDFKAKSFESHVSGNRLALGHRPPAASAAVTFNRYEPSGPRRLPNSSWLSAEPGRMRSRVVPFRPTAEDQCQRRGYLVVTHNQVVAWMRIEWDSGVAKVAGNDPRLVLLMVVNPQLDGGLRHVHPVDCRGGGRQVLLGRFSQRVRRRSCRLPLAAWSA